MDGELRELGKALYERRQEAAVVPFDERRGADWAPVENQCHYNVDRWVSEHPGTRAVRGWLVFDFEKTSMGLVHVVRFTPHSVVEDEDGRLVDITPSGASRRYPFLRHTGSDEEFEQLVTSRMLVHLDHDTSVST